MASDPQPILDKGRQIEFATRNRWCIVRLWKHTDSSMLCPGPSDYTAEVCIDNDVYFVPLASVPYRTGVGIRITVEHEGVEHIIEMAEDDSRTRHILAFWCWAINLSDTNNDALHVAEEYEVLYWKVVRLTSTAEATQSTLREIGGSVPTVRPVAKNIRHIVGTVRNTHTIDDVYRLLRG